MAQASAQTISGVAEFKQLVITRGLARSPPWWQKEPRITAHLDKMAIERLLDPTAYHWAVRGDGVRRGGRARTRRHQFLGMRPDP
jgi:hypothetical protein